MKWMEIGQLEAWSWDRSFANQAGICDLSSPRLPLPSINHLMRRKLRYVSCTDVQTGILDASTALKSDRLAGCSSGLISHLRDRGMEIGN
jgi:hypothetical protein